MTHYFNINGKINAQAESVITPNNRGYLYGDGCFESIKVFRGKPLNLNNHIARILSAADVLKLRVPAYFSENYFQIQIDQLITHAQHHLGGRIRLSLDRSAGGTYKPFTNEASFIIEFMPDDSDGFTINEKGLEIDIFDDIKKPINKLSPLKTKNGLLYVLAAIDAQNRGLDDLLILNEKRSIIESSSCNLFVVSNGVLYTPGLDEGVIAGTMRMTVINTAIKSGIKVYECAIMPQNLLVADEILLTNAISGIQWTGGYRTKRYRNEMAKKLVVLLNQNLTNI